MGQAGRDLGTYGTETARGAWGTAEEAGGNTYRGSGDLSSKILEGIEYVGKGVGNAIGGSADGFYKGFNYGRNEPKKSSPVPGSMKATSIGQFQPVIETGKPAYTGQTENNPEPKAAS